MRFCCGGVGPHSLNGGAFPPPEERSVPSLNVKGWREGVCGVVEAGVGDDTTERQGEVACANMVEVGIGSPPCKISGWVGATSTKQLGARGMLPRPVQRRGRARGRTTSASFVNAVASAAASWQLLSSARGRTVASEAHVSASWRRRSSTTSNSTVRVAVL